MVVPHHNELVDGAADELALRGKLTGHGVLRQGGRPFLLLGEADKRFASLSPSVFSIPYSLKYVCQLLFERKPGLEHCLCFCFTTRLCARVGLAPRRQDQLKQKIFKRKQIKPRRR